MSDLYLFLKPLILTLLFEELGAVLLFGIRNKKDLLLIMLTNIITNPLLVYFSLMLMYYLGIDTGTILTYLVLEPIVVLVEYLIYKKYLAGRKDYLIVSFVLNLISITGGIVCQKIIF